MTALIRRAREEGRAGTGMALPSPNLSTPNGPEGFPGLRRLLSSLGGCNCG